VDNAAESAILSLVLVYALAAWFNTRIPHTGVEMRPLRHDPARSVLASALELLPDFWRCNRRLWNDRLGQISLATTTLFWGVSGNLRYIVLAWAAAALGYSTTQASAIWWGWWPLARRWARWWRPCACGWTWPPASCPWASPWGCWSF
jgi:LPLT family lysophospholipid transporter-like MFS transporter